MQKEHVHSIVILVHLMNQGASKVREFVCYVVKSFLGKFSKYAVVYCCYTCCALADANETDFTEVICFA